jgi:hypothetical protein
MVPGPSAFAESIVFRGQAAREWNWHVRPVPCCRDSRIAKNFSPCETEILPHRLDGTGITAVTKSWIDASSEC